VTILFELTINYYKDRILYKQIEKVLRKILGIEDTTTRFYPSMVNLIYHKDFNIVKKVLSKLLKDYNFEIISIGEFRKRLGRNIKPPPKKKATVLPKLLDN